MTLQRVRDTEAHSRKAFVARLSGLDQIRAQIYLSGTYVRDLLLSPDPDTAKAQAAHLATLKRETYRALDAYGRELEPEEREPFHALRNQIDAYWQVLDATVGWSPQERNRLRFSFFYNELVPRRTAMLQIADRIASVNELGLTRSEERSAASADSLRRYLMWTFAGTLAGGLFLALADDRLHAPAGTGTRPAPGRFAGTLDAAAARTGKRTPRAGARAARRDRAVALGDSDGDGGRRMRGAGRQVSANIWIRSRGWRRRRSTRCAILALLLRPSMLDDLGLAPALNWHARETSKRTGLNVVVSADDAIDSLPDEHRTCIYRLVQEAVNNAVRHANARTVEVAVRSERQKVNVTVQDDGAGFDTRFLRGLGLLGMEERVRRLGGRLKISSRAGARDAGSRVSAGGRTGPKECT